MTSGFILFVFGLFVIPELKGRSLEEVDELFEARLPAWKFASYRTQGTNAKIAALQNNDTERVRKLSVGGAPVMDHIDSPSASFGDEKRFEEKL